MGFFSSLFGTDSGSTTDQWTKQTATQQQQQKQTGTTTATGKAATSTLDPETIAMLKGVIGDLSGGAAGGTADAATIRGIVAQLAGNQNADLVNNQISSASAEARRQFGIGEGAQIAGLEQQIGSKGNSFSQLLEQKGNIDLETSIAAISDQARLDASKQQSANLGAAIAGTSAAEAADQAPLNKFLSAIQVLTGAQTTQTSDQTQISDLLAAITGTQTADMTGKSKGSSSTTQGLFPSLQSWFKV